VGKSKPAGPTLVESELELLRKNKITGQALLEMTEETFSKAGFPLGPAIVLAKAVEALKPPTGSTNMFKLWNSLLAGDYKEEDGIIHLPDGVHWLTEPESLLFLRDCHLGLYDIISRLSAPQELERGVVITGNPGIGKSWLLSYCLYRFAKEKKIVFFESVRTDERWLFKPDGTVTQIEGTRWPPETRDPKTYFLFDPYGGLAPREPRRVGAFTIVASSPDKRNFKEFAKQTGSQKFYMPCWTWSEIEKVIPYLRCDRETARKRYEMFGGILRYIVGNDQWKVELDNAIKSTTFLELQRSVGGAEMLSSVSHKILQYQVDDSYRSTNVRFASKYIAEQVTQRLAETERSGLLHFLYLSRNEPVLAVIRGCFFETIAHSILCKGGKFPVRHLSTGNEEIIELPTLKEERFSVLGPDCFREGTYARPLSDKFSAFDSFGTTESGQTRAFQITVNQAHGLNYNGVYAVLALKKPLDVYFVVPSDKFDSFPKQTISKKDNVQKVIDNMEETEEIKEDVIRKSPGRPRKEYPELEQLVMQYVLSIKIAE